MRTKIDWLFLTRLNSNVELEFFMKQFPKATSAHGNLNKCSICPDNIDGHKMRVLYPYCSCSTECSTRYLINKCLSSSQVVVKGINLHAPSQTIESQENIIEKKGISEKFKEAIEKIIYRNITKPYSIYQMLLLDYGDDTTIPKLTQVQNYMKYRRYKKGDVNSIDGLVEFVTPKLITNIDIEKFAKDEPFYFCNEIFEGREEQHFHLGITSRTLLLNVQNGCVFHFDCTYKIVKYGFPVIVFGCTDIRRKLYPICYFVTSHEQECDYNVFWGSLIEIMSLIKIDLVNTIEYICIDAERASANSINKMLINTKIIMCWYHLKANVSFFFCFFLQVN